MRIPSFSREQIAFAAVMTIVPILLCGFMFGFDIPLASASFWSNPKTDMAAMTSAYEAYVRQPWSFPLTMVSGLLPQPVSIVFSDSIPWLAIVLKATGLGPYFNPLGLFLLISYPLQAWSMVALLRSLGVKDRIPLLIGGLLALLMPAWLARQFGHIALSGHWIVIYGLALSVSAARFGLNAKRVGLFVALAVLAIGIHAYHLIPIAVCFGAALIAELTQRRTDAWTRVPVAASAMLTALAFCAFLLGYGEGQASTGGADALGYYAMNVLAPVWPQASKLFGQEWNGAWFLKVLSPTGEYFEGFQFLGVGLLLLLAALLVLVAKDLSTGRRPEIGFWTRWTPLILGMAVLTVWAIGWVVYAGPWHLFDVPKPKGKVAEVVAIFRAHGRFFWAPAYLLTAIAINWVSRLRRPVGLGVLVAVLLVQAYDTSALRQGVRATFAAPDPLAMPEAFAKSPAIRDRPWVFRPTYFCSTNIGDLRVISQMALVAVRTGGTLNTFPTARSFGDAGCDVVDPAVTVDAAPGDRRMTVVLADGQLEGGPLTVVAKRTDCYRFQRGVICGRDLQGIAGLPPIGSGELSAAREVVQSVRLDQAERPAVLLSGWSVLDPGGKGIWTLGPKAEFQLNAPKDMGPGGFLLDVMAIGFSDQPVRPQNVTLYANGRKLGAHAIETATFFNYRFAVPADVAKPGEPVRFAFDLPDARASTGDPRVLGIAVQELKVLK